MSSAKKTYARVTTKTLQEMKASGEKISMLTAYDYTLGGIVDKAGVDVILVGDSASNVMAGHETTLPITLDQMIYHASGVVRAVERALVVIDLPFWSTFCQIGRWRKSKGFHRTHITSRYSRNGPPGIDPSVDL
jgi:3-methyl-2-oxobutanoate hydroxymethyltransferase